MQQSEGRSPCFLKVGAQTGSKQGENLKVNQDGGTLQQRENLCQTLKGIPPNVLSEVLSKVMNNQRHVCCRKLFEQI